MTDPRDPEPVDAEIVPDPAPTPTPAGPPPAVVPDYDERGVPSFDHVRDKIEGRAATGIGMGELAADTAAGRAVEEQEAERARAATARLDEIRRQMGR